MFILNFSSFWFLKMISLYRPPFELASLMGVSDIVVNDLSLMDFTVDVAVVLIPLILYYKGTNFPRNMEILRGLFTNKKARY